MSEITELMTPDQRRAALTWRLGQIVSVPERLEEIVPDKAGQQFLIGAYAMYGYLQGEQNSLAQHLEEILTDLYENISGNGW